jgi:predicted nucleotidyltransferase component of viral defense system
VAILPLVVPLAPPKSIFSFNFPRHHDLVSENISISSDYLPLYPATILSKHQLVAEKIQALLTRHKPRDYYDIYFLLRSGLLDINDKKHLIAIKDLLSQTTIDFDGELKEYLPRSHWMIIKDFKFTLAQELDRFTR